MTLRRGVTIARRAALRRQEAMTARRAALCRQARLRAAVLLRARRAGRAVINQVLRMESFEKIPSL